MYLTFKKMVNTQGREDVFTLLKKIQGIKPDNLNNFINLWAKNKASNAMIRRLFANKLTITRKISAFDTDENLAETLRLTYMVHRMNCNINVTDLKHGYIDGMKISRWIKKDLLEKGVAMQRIDPLLVDISKVIQNMKIDNYLHLSINPYQYLTASYNTTGWTSCYDIGRQAGYRASTYTYCLDKCTIIGYTTTDSDPMGKKINRVWLHLDEDIVAFNRIYPCHNDILQQEILKVLQEVNINYFTPSSKHYHADIAIDNCEYGYFDFRCGGLTCYGTPKEEKLVIGVYDIPCPFCTLGTISGDDQLCCCDYTYTCCHCGDGINSDDAYYQNGDYYCESCFNQNFTVCDCCDEYFWRDDATHIDSEGITICEDCLSSHYSYCDNCYEYVSNENFITVRYIDGGSYKICCDCAENNLDIISCPCCDEYIDIG